jgi:CubicO group peptidase (beta-lactamase class C family)
MLVDEGKLDWDTPIHQRIPDFRLHDDYATRHATLRDLLSHRTGVAGHYGIQLLTPFDREEVFLRLRYLQSSGGFRERYLYSNVMYDALGTILERVAGTTWEQFVRDRIFEPLEMNHSYPSTRGLELSEDVASPTDERNGPLLNSIFHGYRPRAAQSAGGIVSNVADMSKWILLHLNEGTFGEKRLVSRRSLDQIVGPQVGLSNSPMAWPWGKELYRYAYGFGWELGFYRGRHMIVHNGASGGFTASVAMLPYDDVGVVVLTNHRFGYQLYSLIYNAFDRALGLEAIDWNGRFIQFEDEQKAGRDDSTEPVEEQAAEITVQPPSLPLRAYSGSFENHAYGRYVISFDGDVLQAKFNHIDIGPLEHIDNDSFTSPVRLVPSLDFLVSDEGVVEAISAVWVEGGAEPLSFLRKD